MIEAVITQDTEYIINKNGVKRRKSNGGWGARRLSAQNVGYKICQLCKEEKQLSEFFKRGGPNPNENPRSYCKPCLKAWYKEIHKERLRTDVIYYQKQAERRNNSRQRNKEFVRNYLSDKVCVDCGFDNPNAFHFDHVRGDKTANISQLVARGCAIAKITEEIEKCEIRCANCHLLKTRRDYSKGLQWSRAKPAILGDK